MQRRYGPFILAGSALLAAVTSLWFRVGDAADGAAEVYAARIRTCASGPAPQSEEDWSRIRECIASAIEDAYDHGRVGDLLPRLDEIVSEDPVLRNSCHEAVHTITEKRAVTEESLWRMLNEAGAFPGCDWAFGHAAVLGLASLGPQAYVRGEILRWCNDLGEDQDVRANCLHGVGHHAWKATGSLLESVGACQEVPLDNRSSCASGVLMEMFEPATKTGATYERFEAPEVLPGLCAQWRRFATDERDASCESGAGYVYGLDVRDAAFDLVRREVLTEADVSTAIETVRGAIGRCRDLRNAPSVACETTVAQSVPRDLASREPRIYEELCTVFAPGHPRDACNRHTVLPLR